jgi:hypothetical protein
MWTGAMISQWGAAVQFEAAYQLFRKHFDPMADAVPTLAYYSREDFMEHLRKNGELGENV